VDTGETTLARCGKFPPEFNPVPVRRCRRRFFQSGAVTNVAFTLADGHNQFLVVTNAATGGAVPYVDSWRIRRIHAWAISQDNLATNLSIIPSGTDSGSNNFNDREQAFVISSRSTADPAAMTIKPTRDSPLGSWHFTSNVNPAGVLFICNISTQAGTSSSRCTLDIEFEYVENYLGLPLGYGRTTATLTLGAVGGENILGTFTLQGVNNLG